jgi:hypothetical protein
MDNPKSNRTLALANILTIGFLCADTFILRPIRQTEIFDRYETTETLDADAGTHSHFTNFIHTKSGKRFREPSNSKFSLSSEDTFYIDRSNVLNRPINLICKTDSGIGIVKSGTLNQGYFGVTIAIFIFGVSIINVWQKALIKKPNLNERLLFSGTSILIVLKGLYFY